MRTKPMKLIAGLLGVAALAVGGSTLASAAGTTKPAGPPVVGADHDTLQQGDQAAPDTGSAAEQSSESAAEQSSAADQRDEAGPEKGSAAEQTSESASSERAGETGTEVAGNDGPGGHADEPGNANADYQFQGQQ